MNNKFIEGIQHLPPRMRACYLLFTLGNFTHAQIAQMLNITVGTVGTQIYNARQQLIMQGFGDQEL